MNHLPVCARAVLLSLGLATTPVSANLIANGDFELGDTGFAADITNPGLSGFGAGHYEIVTDPALHHGSATSYGDHTSGVGLMMAVNGSDIGGQLVWGQDSIAVESHTDYDFSIYISSWTPTVVAQLQFSINGASIGGFIAPTTTGQWERFSANWNSGAASTANIRILNDTVSFSGNDFALDDIYFSAAGISSQVPEPSTLGVLVLGLIGSGFARKQRAH